MYQRVSCRILSISLLLLVCNAGSSQILIFDDFSGGGLDTGDSSAVNGGFVLTGNAKGMAGLLDERDSYAEVISREKKNANTGITSLSSFDPLSAAAMSEGLTVEWVVKSISTEVLGGHGNIYTLGTQGDDFFNTAPYIGVAFNGKAETKDNGVRFVGQVNTGEPSHPLSDVYNFDPASFVDGFTVRFTINETGWIFEVEGLDVPVWEEGIWSDFHPRDALDNDCFVAVHTQIPADGEIVARYEKCSVWIGASPKKDASRASTPQPEDSVSYVPRDAVLTWTPGEFAKTHDVYLGMVFDDVNDADRADPRGVLASEDQIATTFDPLGHLDLGQSYFWRVDEVNDSTILKGDVWSFQVEPAAYPMDPNSITATASSLNSGTEGPENTVNGSGLDDNDQHSAESGNMWLSSITGPQPSWIQCEFDKVYKLHQMLVWNYNSTTEAVIGYGVKEATIEYSADGADWTSLGTSHEFARGLGSDGYSSNTTVDLGGVPTKYVRITANSNWGGLVNQFGLSEVRFLYIPVLAQEPDPVSGATDVAVGATLSWKAGREAARHDVYLSTDEQAVIDGAVPAVSVTDVSYSSYLDLGSTYYWRIDEVNDVEFPSNWQGDVWSFSTQEYFVVEDFESYNDIPAGEEGSNLIYMTWMDGFDDPSVNGSTIGYAEAFQPSLEMNTVHGGKQSVPLTYNNSVAAYSEATVNIADLAVGGNWAVHGIGSLSLWFYGDPTNAPEQMYVKLNGVKVLYDGDAANTTEAAWQSWNISLADFAGVDLSNVTQLSIGFDRVGLVGGAGTVLLDDIRLYP